MTFSILANVSKPTLAFLLVLYSFRFLTPAPIAGAADPAQVNEVARQAGANPITVPADKSSASPADSGEISPTGVNDLVMYPSWADVKDMPSWYAKGADVDCLLDVADTLDWLTDTGDINETYDPPKVSDTAPTDQNVNKNSQLEHGRSCCHGFRYTC